MNGTVPIVDFNDTFLSYKHLLNSFPNNKVVYEGEGEPEPPFS